MASEGTVNERKWESRLRRVARRQGLVLRKSRCRNPERLGFGEYALLDAETGGSAFGDISRCVYVASLNRVAKYLGEEHAACVGAVSKGEQDEAGGVNNG
jgi:hypothetical protein